MTIELLPLCASLVIGGALLGCAIYMQSQRRQRQQRLPTATQQQSLLAALPYPAALCAFISPQEAQTPSTLPLLHSNAAMQALVLRKGEALTQALTQALHQALQDTPNTTTPPRTIQLGHESYTLHISQVGVTGTEQTAFIVLSHQEELHTLRTLRDQTLRFFSHDLRSPAASMLSLIHAHAARSINSDHQHPPLASALEPIIQDLLGRIDRFALNAKAQAGQYHLREEFLETLLNDALQNQQSATPRQDLLWVEADSAPPLFVQMDTQLLLPVLNQLLGHAIASSPANSTIEMQILVSETSDTALSTPLQATLRIRYPHGTAPNTVQALDLLFIHTVLQRHQGRFEQSRDPTHTTLQLHLPCVAC